MVDFDMEYDPEPTRPTDRCPIEGCPCRQLETAGGRLLGAAQLLATLLLDVEPDDGVVVLRPRRLPT